MDYCAVICATRERCDAYGAHLVGGVDPATVDNDIEKSYNYGYRRI